LECVQKLSLATLLDGVSRLFWTVHQGVFVELGFGFGFGPGVGLAFGFGLGRGCADCLFDGGAIVACGHPRLNHRHRLDNFGAAFVNSRAERMASFGMIEMKWCWSTAIAKVEKRRKPISACFVVAVPTRIVSSQLGVAPDNNLFP
jgi:hypothetical protein